MKFGTRLLGLAVVAMTGLTFSCPVRGDLIHRSAMLGPTGQTAGFDLGAQYLGSRFSVDRIVQVESVGGHIGINMPAFEGTLFAAIVSLGSPTALPSGNPFDLTTVATTLFAAPFFSTDIVIPLPVRLHPNHYALIFGGEEFGATGQSAMPFNNIDILGQASYFRWDSSDQRWRDNAQGGTRFVVRGTFVPESDSLILFALGILGLCGYYWRCRNQYS